MKQLSQVELQAEQFRDRTLRGAFLAITGALVARPCSTFDNAARDTCPVTPWATLQKAARAASAAAARDGRPIVVATTRARINELYDRLRADALAQLPPESELCVVQAALEETVAQGPADIAGVELLAKPTCRTKLLDFAVAVRTHARRALAAASVAENKALNSQATGVRLWN